MELKPVSPIPMELLQAIDERLPRQAHLLLAIDGCRTSEKKRSRSTFPPGSASRWGVRCSGRRKKSSI